jgi:hypothetical protein
MWDRPEHFACRETLSMSTHFFTVFCDPREVTRKRQEVPVKAALRRLLFPLLSRLQRLGGSGDARVKWRGGKRCDSRDRVRTVSCTLQLEVSGRSTGGTRAGSLCGAFANGRSRSLAVTMGGTAGNFSDLCAIIYPWSSRSGGRCTRCLLTGGWVSRRGRLVSEEARRGRVALRRAPARRARTRAAASASPRRGRARAL